MVLRTLLKSVIFIAIAVAAYLLWKTLRKYTFEEIQAALMAIPADHLALSLAFAMASYLTLSLFDALGVRYVGKRLSLHRTMLASFVSLSLGHNIGVAALSSGAIRYRFYSRWGLSAAEVGLVVVFCGVTVGLGLATLGSASLLLRAQEAATLTGLSHGTITALAIVAGLVPLLYLILAAFWRHPIRFRGHELRLPSLHIAALQLVVGTVNFGFVAASLHQMLSVFSDANYLKVAAVSIIANVAAIISHVPGGVGVLEATVSSILPGAGAIAAVIAFRVVYYFIPLGMGLMLFAISELAIPAQPTAEPRSAR